MSKKKKIGIVIAAVVVLAGIIGFSVNARRKDETLVQVEKVELRDKLIANVSATGEIKPKEYVELQSEIAGVITHVYVNEGDIVAKGDILLRIDPIQTETESRAQAAVLDISRNDALNQRSAIELQQTNVERDRSSVRVAEAELNRAQKNLEIAQASFRRKQELYEDNLISKDVYDAAKAELITSETSLISAEAGLEQAKAQLAVTEVVLRQARNSYKASESRVNQNSALYARTQDLLAKTVIRSPLSGVITKLNVEVGERAVPGTLNNPLATLMEIADLSIIEAEVEVDETDIINVKVGQVAEVKVDALPDTPLKGSVTEVGNSAIAQSASQQEAKDFKVVVQLTEPPRSLRPGLSCTAEITTAIREKIVAVPLQALTVREFEVDEKGALIKPPAETKGKKPSKVEASDAKAKKREKKEFQGVFVVKNGKAEFVQVTTGVTGDTDIEILSGLKAGAEIVTGSFKTLRTLKDGEAVKPEPKDKKG